MYAYIDNTILNACLKSGHVHIYTFLLDVITYYKKYIVYRANKKSQSNSNIPCNTQASISNHINYYANAYNSIM